MRKKNRAMASFSVIFSVIFLLCCFTGCNRTNKKELPTTGITETTAEAECITERVTESIAETTTEVATKSTTEATTETTTMEKESEKITESTAMQKKDEKTERVTEEKKEDATKAKDTTTTKKQETTEVAKEIVYVVKEETVYASSDVNIRKGPGTDYDIVGKLREGDSITRIAKGDNNWSRVKFNGDIRYISSNYLTTEKPVSGWHYYDGTCEISIQKEWCGSKSKGSWCYIAHLVFSNYARFGTSCANGHYDRGTETTLHAANRLGAIFCVNGCNSAPYLNYGVVRSGVLCNDTKCNVPGVYSSATGIFNSPFAMELNSKNLSELVPDKIVTDTFCFGPGFLSDGKIVNVSDDSRAQRTFIGTNGNPGDIWIGVSEGRYVDGVSAGMLYSECAQLLKNKGCTFGIPLDGGGSSTMVFRGKILNHLPDGTQRSLVDFIYFK